MQHKTFYVYVRFRPNGVPCYIGKGTGSRWSRKPETYNNSYLVRIAKKYGLLPVVIIRNHLSEQEAFEIEKALIKAIGRGNDGPLANLTDGGEGVSGLPLEIRKKMGAGKIGKSQSPEHIEK